MKSFSLHSVLQADGFVKGDFDARRLSVCEKKSVDKPLETSIIAIVERESAPCAPLAQLVEHLTLNQGV